MKHYKIYPNMSQTKWDLIELKSIHPIEPMPIKTISADSIGRLVIMAAILGISKKQIDFSTPNFIKSMIKSKFYVKYDWPTLV